MHEEKRIKPTLTQAEMYQISDINQFINKERRIEEKRRLNEVKLQKAVWQNTVTFALFLIFVLLTLAYIGWTQNV